MADIDLTASAGAAVVDGASASTTGQPQGGQAPKLSPLYDQLPEASRKEIKAERFAPLAKLDNLVAEINRLDGEVGNGIRVPGKDATKEQWASYRKEMKIPESPEGYALEIPKLPNGLPYNPNLEKWFRKELFEAGVSQDHAQKMFNDWNQLQAANFTAFQKDREERNAKEAAAAIETLKAEYKDSYPEKMQMMSAAMARYMSKDLLDTLNATRTPDGVRLTDNPVFMKAWINIGERMADDTMVGGQAASGGSAGAKRTWEREGLPKSPSGFVFGYPAMENDPRFQRKAE